jgi:hypothetical protein
MADSARLRNDHWMVLKKIWEIQYLIFILHWALYFITIDKDHVAPAILSPYNNTQQEAIHVHFNKITTQCLQLTKIPAVYSALISCSWSKTHLSLIHDVGSNVYNNIIIVIWVFLLIITMVTQHDVKNCTTAAQIKQYCDYYRRFGGISVHHWVLLGIICFYETEIQRPWFGLLPPTKTFGVLH